MFSSVADWCSLVDQVEAVPDHIAGALEHQRTHHPRPAVVTIPTDLLECEAEVEVAPYRELPRATADPAAVAQAAQMLASAERPVLWAGGGVMWSGASAELVELAERLEAPVVSGDGGKGAFPEDHSLSLGTTLGGRIWGDNPLHEYISTRDVLLVVGSSLPLRSTTGVGLRLPEGLVQIDIDHSTLGRNYPVAVGLVGDARAVLRQLLDAVGSRRSTGREEFRSELEALKVRLSASAEAVFPNEMRLWTGIRSVLERNAVVVTDSTVAAHSTPRCFTTYEPLTYLSPHGWVSIGYGFPASLGVQAALPGRQVLCVTGDAAFSTTCRSSAPRSSMDSRRWCCCSTITPGACYGTTSASGSTRGSLGCTWRIPTSASWPRHTRWRQ